MSRAVYNSRICPSISPQFSRAYHPSSRYRRRHRFQASGWQLASASPPGRGAGWVLEWLWLPASQSAQALGRRRFQPREPTAISPSEIHRERASTPGAIRMPGDSRRVASPAADEANTPRGRLRQTQPRHLHSSRFQAFCRSLSGR